MPHTVIDFIKGNKPKWEYFGSYYRHFTESDKRLIIKKAEESILAGFENEPIEKYFANIINYYRYNNHFHDDEEDDWYGDDDYEVCCHCGNEGHETSKCFKITQCKHCGKTGHNPLKCFQLAKKEKRFCYGCMSKKRNPLHSVQTCRFIKSHVKK